MTGYLFTNELKQRPIRSSLRSYLLDLLADWLTDQITDKSAIPVYQITILSYSPTDQINMI